jgi:hypothetical protein
MRDIDDEKGKNDWVRAIVDVPGVGGGVVDRLAFRSRPTTAARHRSTRNGSSTLERRTAGHCASASNGGEIDIDPDDDKLAAQLGSTKWGIDSRGRIKIESKDDMRKRGLPSPDRADACAIAFAGRANAAPMNVDSHAGESITGDLMTKAW